MGPALKYPPVMTVAEFLTWNAPNSGRWQLTDGEVVGMAPASRTHATLQLEIGRRIANHLEAIGSLCVAMTEPGIIPHIRAHDNFRIPDIAVTCSAYDTEEYDVANPILIVEIQSPSNRAQTRANIWAYTTIPSLREIVVLSSTAIRAEVLRRGPDGAWPISATIIENGDLVLDSLGLTVPLAALYGTTRLAARL